MVHWFRFLAFVFQRTNRGIQAFEEMWRAVRAVTRMKYFAGNPDPAGYHLPMGIRFSEAEPPQICGFHEREEIDGREFRWTEPVAFVRLRLEPGDYTCRIEAGEIRGDAQGIPLKIVFNQHVIQDLKAENGVISFRMTSDSSADVAQLLVMVSEALEVGPEESRKLGLPVFDLQVLPCSESDDVSFQSRLGAIEGAFDTR